MSWIAWVIAAVFLGIIEVITVSVFFFMCIGIGALFAGIASALGAGIWMQIAVFAAVSIVSVLFIRPVLGKYLKKTDSKPSNIDEIIGKEALVTHKITEENQGFIKIMGEVWGAFSESGEIEKDSTVIIVSVKGTRVIVRKKTINK